MKVVYIADIGIAGGATKSLVELVETMKNEYDIEPIVLTSGNNLLNEQLNARNIKNYSFGYGAFLQGAPDSLWKKPIKWMLMGAVYYFHYFPALKKALKTIDWNTVDLIHTNVARDDIGMEISKRTGVPSICHIREFAELDFNCWSYRPHYARYLNESTREFIAISDAVKKYWVKKGLSEDKIDVVYNGVDREKILVANHSTWESDETIRLVIVGGVIPNKGQWQAIEAICSLPEKIKKYVRLDIIGGITVGYKNKLSVPLQKAGMLSNVRFLGACNDVYTRLKEYDIGLMCSKAEGFGRVTVEYMHAGLAVIASDCGANPELIQNNITGILYDQNHTETLTQAILYLINNRKRMIEIAEKGKAFAESHYTKELNAKNIYKIYQKCACSTK